MITSKDNAKIKELKLLKKNKQYVFLDNPKLIQEAIAAKYNLEFLIINENKSSDYKNLFDLNKQSTEIIELSNSLFNSFSSTCNSQGIIGVIKNINNKIKKPKGNFIVLDNLQDPGNIGTILRSALGADFKDIYLINCVNILNDKLVRSSMGAIFKLNIFECDKNEFFDLYNKELTNFDIYIAHMEGENVFNIHPKRQFGIVLGNEGKGISEEMFNIANKKVCVPMKNGLESLNVAIAGSIMMFELNKSL